MRPTIRNPALFQLLMGRKRNLALIKLPVTLTVAPLEDLPMQTQAEHGNSTPIPQKTPTFIYLVKAAEDMNLKT